MTIYTAIAGVSEGKAGKNEVTEPAPIGAALRIDIKNRVDGLVKDALAREEMYKTKAERAALTPEQEKIAEKGYDAITELESLIKKEPYAAALVAHMPLNVLSIAKNWETLAYSVAESQCTEALLALVNRDDMASVMALGGGNGIGVKAAILGGRTPVQFRIALLENDEKLLKTLVPESDSWYQNSVNGQAEGLFWTANRTTFASAAEAKIAADYLFSHPELLKIQRLRGMNPRTGEPNYIDEGSELAFAMAERGNQKILERMLKELPDDVLLLEKQTYAGAPSVSVFQIIRGKAWADPEFRPTFMEIDRKVAGSAEVDTLPLGIRM